MKKLFSVRTIILAGSVLLQLSTLCFRSRGAAGDVDLSFDAGSGVDGQVNSMALQPDGKVLIAGQFTTVKGLARRGVARLNAEGIGDSSFDAGSVISAGWLNYHVYGIESHVYGIALQPDGKVLVGQDQGVIRLNADGSLDSSFNLYAVAGDYLRTTAIALQPDGKVLVGGTTAVELVDQEGYTFYFFNHFLSRVNVDGSHDASFFDVSWGSEDGNSGIHSIFVQPDGKILFGSEFTIGRLNANGSGDSSFTPGASGGAYSIAVQADGKVLIGGWSIGYGTNRNPIARLNGDGSLDGSFNSNIKSDPGDGGPVVHSLALQPDGKILIGGFFITINGTNRNRIARLNTNGSLDSSFNPGTGANDEVDSVVVQSDGNVLIGGSFTTVNGTIRNRMSRLNASGSLDGSFHAGLGVSAALCLAVRPDGKTLIGGGFTTVQDLASAGIARLNINGSVDPSFTSHLAPSDPFYNAPASVHSMAVQPDGKVLVGGFFRAMNGTNNSWGIARLDAAGTVDIGFNPGYYLMINSIALQPDGKVLVGGASSLAADKNYDGIISRLNANGSPDGSFNPGTGANGTVWSIALQPDGKILIGGSFTTFNGANRNRIVRLNSNGTLDGSFNPDAGGNGFDSPAVYSIVVQSDGKVLIGGSFITVSGTNCNRIARLNANGTVDGSFNAGVGDAIGAYPVIKSLAVQPDGKVLVGGAFSTVNGSTNRNGFARLNANGSLDDSFSSGAGGTGGEYRVVNSVVIQTDGNVLIGGDFTTVNGVVRPHVARLYGDFAAPTLNIARSNAFIIVSWPVSGLNFQLQESTNVSLPNSWSPVALSAATNTGQISVTVPASVLSRFFRLKSQ